MRFQVRLLGAQLRDLLKDFGIKRVAARSKLDLLFFNGGFKFLFLVVYVSTQGFFSGRLGIKG